MAIAVDDLLDSVSITLLDTQHRGWPRSELLIYLREALAATAAAQPNMYPLQEFVPLIAGVTQTIPAGGVSLLEVQFNEVSGRVVRGPVDRDLLNEANRYWPAATQETDVWDYAVDARDPRRFAVTPPNDGTGSVQVLYGAVPTVTGSSGESLDIAESYRPAFTEYMLGKAYMKNSKSRDPVKSQTHMQTWGTLVGLKVRGQQFFAPKAPGAGEST